MIWEVVDRVILGQQCYKIGTKINGEIRFIDGAYFEKKEAVRVADLMNKKLREEETWKTKS